MQKGNILCSYPNISFLHTKFIFLDLYFYCFGKLNTKKMPVPEN